MDINKRIARRILQKRPFDALFQGISDIRKNPTIDLRTILTWLFLMPFFSLTSLLNLDREARTQRFRALFDCTRRLVVSDTTLRRMLLQLLPRLHSQDLLTRWLAEHRPLRRLGVLDGTFMGGHWLSVLCLCGPSTLPPSSAPGALRAMSSPAAMPCALQTHCRPSSPVIWGISGQRRPRTAILSKPLVTGTSRL